MSASNQSELPGKGDPAGSGRQANEGKSAAGCPVEVVWSSPVITGGFISSQRPGVATAQGEATHAQPAQWQRHVFAYESDLLDSAFINWEEGHEPTLEMIPGFKSDETPAIEHGVAVETVASGAADQVLDGSTETIMMLKTARLDPQSLQRAGLQHFQPDTRLGGLGPNVVRADGYEDPVTGWRPTGMVFFETLATPPRGTVYSTTLLEEFERCLAGGEAGDQHSAHSASPEAAPFFDFPDGTAPAPPDDTEDFPMEVVVTGGGGGGRSGSVRFFKLFGKLVLLGMAFCGLAVLAVAGSYAMYVKKRLYDDTRSGRFATVIVKPGQNFRSILDDLRQQGMLHSFMGLDDSFMMRYLAYVYENSDKIKAGVYRFDTGANLNDIYDKLISGSKDYKITIPEGKTASEVGKIVASQYSGFSYDHFMELVNDPAYAQKLGVDAPALEGYLYPSTYAYGPGMKEEELIKLMVATFQSKVKAELEDKITSDGLSFHEHVIMASLIEREARMNEDRPLIASVIFNRLAKGIPLQVDATVNFALNNWRRLTNEDYKVESPYNTYKIKGLPPGPIASPRIESLAATYTAPQTNYLYYVHKGNGRHAFAETYAQHLANVGRYIREKNVGGMGNTPATREDEEVLLKSQTEEKQPALAGGVTIEPAQEEAEPPKDEPAPAAEEEATPEPAPKKESAKKDEEPAADSDAKPAATEDDEKPAVKPKPKSY